MRRRRRRRRMMMMNSKMPHRREVSEVMIEAYDRR